MAIIADAKPPSLLHKRLAHLPGRIRLLHPLPQRREIQFHQPSISANKIQIPHHPRPNPLPPPPSPLPRPAPSPLPSISPSPPPAPTVKSSPHPPTHQPNGHPAPPPEGKDPALWRARRSVRAKTARGKEHARREDPTGSP